MLQTIARTGQPIATPHDTLHRWNLRCGGKGLCGACRITLVQGVFSVAGSLVRAGAFRTEANACQTTLVSATGIIDIPDSALLPTTGAIATHWQASPLPDHDAPVIAIDIGTTTLAAARIEHAAIVRTATAFNPQAIFGDNIISRIAHAATPDGQAQLQQAIATALDQLVRELDDGAEPPARLAIAGNTTMTSLLWGIDPTPIGHAPFAPHCRHFPTRTALSLGLRSLPPDTPILAVPAISAFVGGDLTAGLHETNPDPGDLLIDLGTNCEIILHAGDRILCTAAAAGPAFEGSGITAGRRATPGAIDHLHADLSFSTIGGRLPPDGLCGSAMLDLLAHGRRAGWLDRFGLPIPGQLGDHAAHDAHGTPAILVTDGILVTAADIEQLLKAKAAIAAGIRALLDAASLTPGDLRRIHLAGGFANYLDLDSARAIGMLPPGVPCVIVGNTSLAGAARLACQPQLLHTLDQLADTPTEIPLNDIPSFEQHYIDALTLAP